MGWVIGYIVGAVITCGIAARIIVKWKGGPMRVRRLDEEDVVVLLSFVCGLAWPVALVMLGCYRLLIYPVVNRLEDSEIVQQLDGSRYPD